MKIMVPDKGQNVKDEHCLYAELTGKIIGCAMEVHKTLGNGFQEIIYQRALDIEMSKQGLAFSREHEMEISYKGVKIGNRRVDFFVEQKVMVEIKAVDSTRGCSFGTGHQLPGGVWIGSGLASELLARSLQFKRMMRSVRERV